jgi:glycine cleavage system H protein
MIVMVAILVVLFILLVLAIDALVHRKEAAPLLLPVRRQIALPGGLFLDSGHTWTALEPSGRIRVGLDDLVRGAVGRIDKLELPELGTEVKRGQPLFALVQGGRRAALVSPVDGVVSSVNPLVADTTGPVAADPYQRGWVCALSPKNLGASLRRLKVAEEAIDWLRAERDRFEKFVVAQAWRSPLPGMAMADGGKPADGVLGHLDDEAWATFGRDFLAPQDPPIAE